MLLYTAAAVGVVLASSALLLVLFGRKKLLNASIIISTALCSILTIILVPVIFNAIADSTELLADVTGRISAVLITFIIYLMLLLAFTVLISSLAAKGRLDRVQKIVSEKGVAATKKIGGIFSELAKRKSEKRTGENVPDQQPEELTVTAEQVLPSEQPVPAEPAEQAVQLEEAESTDGAEAAERPEQDDEVPDSGYTGEEHVQSEPIESSGRPEVIIEVPDGTGTGNGIGPDSVDTRNNIKDNVDTGQNTGRMCIESVEFLDEKKIDDMDIEECIDEAFRLKSEGDFENAVRCYMHALGKQPDKDLVFWIVLDICGLYKSLGQVELAREILSAYAESYKDVMDDYVRDEIEKNLISA